MEEWPPSLAMQRMGPRGLLTPLPCLLQVPSVQPIGTLLCFFPPPTREAVGQGSSNATLLLPLQ